MSQGGLVVDLDVRPRATGPTSEAAIATAEALGAPVDELDRRERTTAALGLEGGVAPRQ